jgi:hypothetical protein
MTFAMSGHDFSTMFFGTVGHLIFRQMPMIIGNQEKIQELHQKGPTKKNVRIPNLANFTRFDRGNPKKLTA